MSTSGEGPFVDAFMDAVRQACAETGAKFDGHTIILPPEPLRPWRASDRLTRQDIERGLQLEHDAQTGPWMLDKRENFGENWCLATLGEDDDGDWILTTDGVHASETNGASPQDDGHFIVWSRNYVGRMLRELERLYALEMGGKLAPQE